MWLLRLMCKFIKNLEITNKRSYFHEQLVLVPIKDKIMENDLI